MREPLSLSCPFSLAGVACDRASKRRLTHRNAQRKYQGHSLHPLNDAGRDQARRLADVLRSVPIKQCHASDLPRAEEVSFSYCTGSAAAGGQGGKRPGRHL